MASEPDDAISDDEPTGTGRAIFRDVARIYLAVLLLIIVAAVLSQFINIVAQMLVAIAALAFFLVPERVLERRGEDPADYGMTQGNLRKGVVYGLAATLLTLPFFIPGYWVWEKYGLKRDFDPDMGRYRQWSSELEGEPAQWGSDGPGAWVWSDRDVMYVGIRNDGKPNNKILIRADVPFKPEKRGTITLKPLTGNAKGESKEWEVMLTHSRSRGAVSIRGPDRLRVEAQPIVAANPTWPVYTGAQAEKVDGEFSDSRSYWWLILWIATQFLLVALPEEVFYRGFIQTRLEQAFKARGNTTSWLGFTPAIFWTSVLFGVGHLVVPVGGALLANRMSVFFPSLLFGWLRRRTGSVTASTIYHACSNAMVLVAAVHFS